MAPIHADLRPRPAEPGQRAGRAPGRRGRARDRVEEPELHEGALPRQLPPRPDPSLPAERARAAGVRRLLRAPSASSCSPRSIRWRSTRRASIRRTSSTACASSAPSASRSRRSTAASASRMLEYSKLMELLGSVDGNVEALLSAHQSIGVPQPLLYFGTEEQKRRFLPRCAAGEISAFALTEDDVGSDPARLATTAELSADGTHYVLNGSKLWCTNGTLAELLVVMARDRQTQEDQRLRRRDGLARREGRAPLPLHGPAGARQRGDLVHGRAGAGREPDRRRGQGPQDRAHHAQHRAPGDSRRIARQRQAVPRDLPHLGRRARAVGPADRQARGDRPQARRHGGDHLRDGGDDRARLPDGRSRRLRHPPRSGGGEAVEHRAHLGDRRRHDADPRRPRLRDRAVAGGARRGADPGRADDARLPHQPDLRGLVRDHAPVHGARGGRQAPPGRRRPDRSREAVRRQSEGVLPRRRLLRLVVPDPLARLGTLAALLGVRQRSPPTCASSSARRASSRGRSSTA